MAITADQIIETLDSAKEENALDRYRTGQVVELPPDHEVWMTGDIHDHRSNFNKLLAAANLAANPNRHLILHELIHGDHYGPEGAEDSWKMLAQAAELKLDFPDQVHFLFANHDLAQIHGEGIMKSGLSVCEAFNKGVKRDFASRALKSASHSRSCSAGTACTCSNFAGGSGDCAGSSACRKQIVNN